MKALEQRLPLMAGDWPNPVGFIDISTTDGVKLKSAASQDIPRWGGKTVRTLQGRHSIHLWVDFTEFDPLLLAAICGDALAVAAYGFRQINPHWYLAGDDA